ncbi:hypothetical protein MPH_06999 [Macrophomina phaseolina MS6]|uniref:Uncharacterized protein n=1 Tax=Macrophomina phaseolina (strain MS6) TaxID=1126212 RepID=K2R0N9_MACPH|nr:hypothetical protein MPH_06999 [Macrophomina phaseolina MS6]
MVLSLLEDAWSSVSLLQEAPNCPGYQKPTTWIVHDQSSKCLTRSRHRPLESSQKSRAIPVRPKHSKQPAQVASCANSSRNTANLQLPPNLAWVPSDEFTLQTLDSVIYYNEHIAPFVVPDVSVMEWSLIQLKDWQDEPNLIKQVHIMTCVQHKAVRCNKDLERDLEVCKQRQHIFELMNKHLSQTTTQTSDETLNAILMLLVADVMFSAKNTWYAHVHGAATIIELRGGWQKYIESTCDNQYSASFFLSLLGQSPSWPYILAEEFPDWDEIGVITCFPCPDVLFQAISRINRLRAALYRKDTTISTSRDPDHDHSIHQLRAILTRITSFSPSAWLSHLVSTASFNLSSPDWLALIQCYHAATLLYCIRTLVLESSLRNDERLSPLLEDIFGTSVAEAVRIGAVRAIFQYLGCTTSSSSGTGLLPRSSAWNAVVWPLVIAGYEAGGSGLAPEEGRGMRNFVAGKMDELALLLGTRSLLDARTVLERCWESRRSGGGRGLDGGWTWDETFAERCVFIF